MFLVIHWTGSSYTRLWFVLLFGCLMRKNASSLRAVKQWWSTRPVFTVLLVAAFLLVMFIFYAFVALNSISTFTLCRCFAVVFAFKTSENPLKSSGTLNTTILLYTKVFCCADYCLLWIFNLVKQRSSKEQYCDYLQLYSFWFLLMTELSDWVRVHTHVLMPFDY